MTAIKLILGCCCLFFYHTAWAQSDSIPTSAPVYTTQQVEGIAPTIDGMLDDAAWQQVPWSQEYTQYQPADDTAATQRTVFKILYDKRYLYMAWRCYDDSPGGVEARLGRRDDFPGDWVEVNFDSFNDKRTAFSFSTSASGVKGDEFISKDGEDWESSWNPTWLTKAKVDSLGYTVESRIPFSQLRFGKAEEQVWGMQSNRRVFRNDELDTWTPVKQSQQGWVSRFGKLRGIKGVEPRKPLELQPYVLGQLRTGGDYDPDNPFSSRVENRLSGGLDGRIGLTNDIAVDFTINPDFGQVEADPGAINLDGFQIFFREQRPFFVENQNIFTYNVTEAEAGGDYNADLVFYSRRIGSSPSRIVNEDSEANFYVDRPENTTIIGATKVSGKTQEGFSIGLLNSVTQREYARLDDQGERYREVVEPLTSYTVARLQQDLNQRNTTVGVIATAVNRQLNAGTEELRDLHHSAYTGGLDVLHRWDNRAWYVSANMVASQVRGSKEAITRTQTAFERLFQRPDAEHLSVDSSQTSLAGTGGTLRVGNSEGNWVFETGATWRSPGLELNDIGFLQNSEQISYFAWSQRRWQQPFGIFRRLIWNQNIYLNWDWSGRPLGRSLNTNTFMQFKNLWAFRVNLSAEQQDISTTALRGGPALWRPPGYFVFMGFGTNNTKQVLLSPYVQRGGSYDGTVASTGFGMFVRWQALPALSLSLDPEFEQSYRGDQYIDQVESNQGLRYLNGKVDQTTLSITLRATYSLTPNLTIQYYGQPFIAKGQFSRFNRVTNPTARAFDDRFLIFSDQQLSVNKEEYVVDENGDGVSDYTFSDPDFNFMQFRSNLVARWEYLPNSEIFLVWAQGTTTDGDPTKGVLRSLGDDLLGGSIRNTFLLKATYRWVR